LPWNSVLVALLFGSMSYLTIYFRINFSIPGININSDPRELFNILGAAIGGPFAGIIIGTLSSLTPQVDYQSFVIFQHCLSAAWAGWAYNRFIYGRARGWSLFLRWMFLIFVYYYCILVFSFFLLLKFAPAAFYSLLGTSLSGMQAIRSLLIGCTPEAFLTLLYCYIIYIAMPDKFRRPLWKSNLSLPRNIRPKGTTIAIRLIIWFMIFFSLPIIYLSISARNYFSDDVLRNEAGDQLYVATRLTQRLQSANIAESKRVIEMVNQKYERNIVLVNGLFINVINSDSIKDKKDYLSGLSPEQRAEIRKNRNGTLTDTRTNLAAGYAQVPGHDLYVLSFSQEKRYAPGIDTYVRFVLLHQGIALLLVSILSGLIIRLIIGIPLKKLAYAAHQIGKQNYDTPLETDDMEDEIRVLAETVGTMGQNIKMAEKELRKHELKFRTIYENANDAILLILDGIIVDCNSKGRQLFGCEEEDLLNHSPADLSPEIQPDGSNSHDKAHEKLKHALTGIPQFFEWRHCRHDGLTFEAEVSLIRIVLENVAYVQAMIRDITERKVMYNALKMNEAKFRSLVNCMQDLVYTLDRESRLTGLYGQWAEIYGLIEESLIGHRLSLILSPKDSKSNAIACEKALEGIASIFEWEITKGDERFHFESSLTPLFDAQGDVMGIVGVAREITARRNAERWLKESEDRYRSLVNNSPDAIVVHVNGKIVFVNPSVPLLTGAPSIEYFIGRHILEFIHPAYHEVILKRIELVMLEKRILPLMEIKVRRADDVYVDAEIGSVPIVYDGHDAVQSIVRNISERKRSEMELKKLSQAVNQSSTGILITDDYGAIEYVNQKLIETTGYSRAELIGENPRIFNSGMQTREFYAHLWKTIRDGREWHGEIFNRKKSGDTYWERNHISSIKNDKGEITHFIAIKEDISELKKIEEELISAKEKAEEADMLKSTLLANMSHEFRTPLNGILGFTEILKEEILDQAYNKMLEKIAKSGKRLMNTLNSVLLISQLANDDFFVQHEPIDMNNICQKILAEHGKSAHEKNLVFEYSIVHNQKLIYSDEDILLKAISCMVENAVKYTTTGTVKLEFEVKSHQNKSDALYITVQDTGIGISTQDMEVIFKEFKQISEGYRREYEGLGLGLSIARKMVTLLHGEILVNSMPGVGSTFTIIIPLNPEEILDIPPQPADGTIKKIPSSKVAQPRILFVEDNMMNVEVVQFFLMQDWEFHFANDSAQAIATAKQFQFDLLLLDINLSGGLDGISVLKAIRSLTGYQDIPAIAVTGYASSSDKHHFLSEGFNAFLPKPFNKEELLKCIKDVLAAK
jgi:PAS domain S-box-containing protein